MATQVTLSIPKQQPVKECCEVDICYKQSPNVYSRGCDCGCGGGRGYNAACNIPGITGNFGKPMCLTFTGMAPGYDKCVGCNKNPGKDFCPYLY